MNQRIFLEGDKFENYSTSDLIKIVDSSLLLQRAKALFFLAKRCKTEEKIIPKVTKKIFDSENRTAKLLGMVTVSFLGIAGLVEANTPKTKKIISDFRKTLSKYEYEDLVYFLESFDTENISLQEQE